METLGTRIREAREAMGLTIASFAARLDTHASQVSRWENDHQVPSQRWIKRLVEVTGRGFDYFGEAAIPERDEAPPLEPTGTTD